VSSLIKRTPPRRASSASVCTTPTWERRRTAWPSATAPACSPGSDAFLLLLLEEGRLNDLPLRENFVERVFACRKRRDRAYGGMPSFPLGSFSQRAARNCTIAWTKTLDEEPTVSPSRRPRRRREAPGGLVPVPAVRAGKFHTAHKLTREAGTGLLRAMAHGHWKGRCPGTTPRWPRRSAGAISVQTRASGTGTNRPPSTAPN
jgi:hypothetical protein